MQEYQETDTVQDLYNEIEHLIDIPFDQFSKNSPHQPVKNKDFYYKDEQLEEYNDEEEYSHHPTEQQQQQQAVNDYTFERPILIESDSDDIEEELVTPDQAQYSIMTCYKCDKPIPFQPTNSLTVTGANNVCAECFTKKRTRSSSFTFSQLADKLKQSFGHSSTSNSSNNFLSPGVKSVDRRKSMPSMNSVFNNNETLEPPSPTPSRPSSRASSFIEDVKQFLAPLSRKSSRNSMYQDYQRDSSPIPPEGPKRKSSHNSLLDAINICKPGKPKQTPSYERRVIHQQEDFGHHNNWTQEDEEVMDVHQNGYYSQRQEPDLGFENNVHIPLRRKQIKQIESRQDRIDIYNNAYMECMRIETDLVPWIIKQTQKGPPDAWFGYTPPAREPKKVLGIFKRKPKATDSNTTLRAQQQQLGDELLNRSTPLLQHRYSNSNLSISPSNNSFMYSPDHHQQELTTSPSAMGYGEEEEAAEYFDERYTSPSHQSNEQHRSVLSSSTSPSRTTSFSPSSNNEPATPITTARSQSTQPVSILKKTNSSINLQRDYQPQSYDDYGDHPDYDDEEEEEEDYSQPHDYQPAAHYPRQQQQCRPSSAAIMEDYQQQMMVMPKERKQRYHPSSPGYTDHHHQQMYMMEPPPLSRRGRSNSGSYRSEYDRDDYYNNYHRSNTTTPPTPSHRRHYEELSYYNDSIMMNKKRSSRRNSRQQQYYDDDEVDRHYQEEEDYYHQPPDSSRRKAAPSMKKSNSSSQQREDYYGMSVKLTPYMMEEWEIALDDLCDLYPRLDRHYINDFLRSAQGDFVTAKDMIMEMIMEIR